MGQAAVSSGFKYKNDLFKVIGTGYFMAYYFFMSKNAQLEVKRFSINPTFEVAHTVWNLLDTKGIKQLYTTSLPGIKFRQKLFLKRNDKVITRELISELIDTIKNNKMKSITENIFPKHYTELNNLKNTTEVETKGELFLKTISDKQKKGI